MMYKERTVNINAPYLGVLHCETTHVVIDEAEGKSSVHKGEAPL